VRNVANPSHWCKEPGHNHNRALRSPTIIHGAPFFQRRGRGAVALRRRRLRCPLCEFSTPHRYNQQAVESIWRHLDLGIERLELRAQLRRL
jgi:hypothetical protein